LLTAKNRFLQQTILSTDKINNTFVSCVVTYPVTYIIGDFKKITKTDRQYRY